MRVAEELLAESLEEKDPGLFTTGATKADRELEVAVREGIITFFHDHDSDEAKTLADITSEVSESISSWRKPSLNEFEAILDSVAETIEGVEKIGEINITNCRRNKYGKPVQRIRIQRRSRKKKWFRILSTLFYESKSDILPSLKLVMIYNAFKDCLDDFDMTLGELKDI